MFFNKGVHWIFTVSFGNNFGNTLNLFTELVKYYFIIFDETSLFLLRNKGNELISKTIYYQCRTLRPNFQRKGFQICYSDSGKNTLYFTCWSWGFFPMLLIIVSKICLFFSAFLISLVTKSSLSKPRCFLLYDYCPLAPNRRGVVLE